MTIEDTRNINDEELQKLVEGKAVHAEKKNNVKQTLFILAKSFIASGVLFLPKAYELYN